MCSYQYIPTKCSITTSLLDEKISNLLKTRPGKFKSGNQSYRMSRCNLQKTIANAKYPLRTKWRLRKKLSNCDRAHVTASDRESE